MEDTLEESLSRVLREPLPSAAGARSLDKLASLRRSGGPWIEFFMGMSVGVDHDDWPFTSMMFLRHLYRYAAYCSQSEEWLDLRARHGFRELDVTVEFRRSIADGDATPPSYHRDELGIRWASKTRLDAFVPRPVPEGDQTQDPADVGDAEAAHVMDEVRRLLLSLPAKPA